MIKSFFYTIKQAFLQFGRNFNMALASIFAITAMLLILSLFFILVINVNTAVNFRSGPGTNYELIGTVAKGTVCDVLSKNGSWYQVRTPQGKVGYILDSYLKIETAPLKTATVINAGTGLNLRTGEGTNYPSLGKIPNGSVVTILSENGEWDFIRTASGQEAYVASAYLRINP